MKRLLVGILLLSGCKMITTSNVKVHVDTLLTTSNRCALYCKFTAPCVGVIQYKNSLTDTNWQVLWSSNITTTQTVEISFTNINVSQQYYRAMSTK